MAVREIRKLKDELLYKKSREVEVIDDKIKEIANDMIETMYKYDGIGIAACQVGILKRIVVYDSEYVKDDGVKNPKVLINPVITKSSKQMVTTEEGCLSFPDLFGYVDRHEKITVEAKDLNGSKIIIHAKDVESIVLQHEIDHLDGRVFVDIAYNTYVGEKEDNTKDSKNNKKYKKSKK
ncbi:MAG: polypeptide deformylase [Clostridia bacterium]|jgi:peptide deformylase|nr:polypeptide deformylase [Clostridia bacterium]